MREIIDVNKITEYELTKDDLTGKELFDFLMNINDLFERSRLEAMVLEQAKMFGMKTEVNNMIRQKHKEERKAEREAREIREQEEKAEKEAEKTRLMNYVNTANGGLTNFTEDQTGKSYPPMICAGWIADENGISTFMNNQIIPICRQPILPIKQLKNLETGVEQVVLAYKRRGKWEEVTVPRRKVANAKNIVDLADLGISVTSETARALVRYISDIEAFNEKDIPMERSTSKLGWRADGVFSPYDKSIIFDGENRFGNLYSSIKSSGDYFEWMQLMKELRSSGSIEPRVALAASFASVLVSRLEILPFMVDFYGQTEGGKTVTLMVAASVWGEPSTSTFIGNFRTTDTAAEARNDMLNNLPLILDDSKNISARMKQNLESFIYNLCSGKGKSRSNKELGILRENTWSNNTIISGENPISEHATSGGAINRIIEVECSETIYEDPAHVAETVSKNFGQAGKIFVAEIKKIGEERLKEMFRDIQMQFTDKNVMQKQIMSASAILLADQIATDVIFGDDMQLSVEDMKDMTAKKEEVSEGMRAYRYLQDIVVSERQHFDPGKDNIAQWGFPPTNKNGERWMFFIPACFDKILDQGGFSKTAFLNWADNRGLVKKSKKGSFIVTTRWIDDVQRMINIKDTRIIESDDSPDDDEEEMVPAKEIPFEEPKTDLPIGFS